MEIGDTHSQIVESCRKGDRHAQFELYRLYSKAMYNICLRMVRNETDAEDLLQNSFIDVFSKLDSFRQEATIGSWIKRIVVNNCINFLKKRRLHFEELDDRFHHLSEHGSDGVPTDTLDVTSISKAVNRLPDGYRVVFSLYAMEGYDHEEIAQILEISESTSKSQYSRAKRKLQDLLAEQGFVRKGH